MEEHRKKWWFRERKREKKENEKEKDKERMKRGNRGVESQEQKDGPLTQTKRDSK